MGEFWSSGELNDPKLDSNSRVVQTPKLGRFHVSWHESDRLVCLTHRSFVMNFVNKENWSFTDRGEIEMQYTQCEMTFPFRASTPVNTVENPKAVPKINSICAVPYYVLPQA